MCDIKVYARIQYLYFLFFYLSVLLLINLSSCPLIHSLAHTLSHAYAYAHRQLFSPTDQVTFDGVKALAASLKQQKRFVNLAGCAIQCSICDLGFKGQNEAQEHAKLTGHMNFKQVE